VLLRDSLSRPGPWRDSVAREQDARCVVRDVLRATRNGRGTFQCTGPQKVIKDVVGVEVTTTLETLGSCAAIWIHWDDADGGQVLRVCQQGFTLAADAPDDQRSFGTLALARLIPLHRAVRVGLVVGGGTVGVLMNGDQVGRIRLPEDSADDGQVVLGVGLPSLAVPLPYSVTFADIVVRAL
jgi:hypothetical protein